MDAITALLGRRSIRRYTDEAVSDEDMQTILKAAMAAPTANNSQSWRFIVVRDEAVRLELSKTSEWTSMLAGAPVVMLVCGEPAAEKVPDTYWVQDGSAAIENILIAVHALGLGAVWCGVHPRQDRKDHVRATLGTPQGIEPLGLIGIGHPVEVKTPSERFDPDKVHYERW